MSKSYLIETGTVSALATAFTEAKITPAMFKVIDIAPDLLEIVKYTLPGRDGIGIMMSITSSLALRAARLAGMITTSLAADVRIEAQLSPDHTAIGDFNSAMSLLDQRAQAERAFDEAGIHRKPLIDDLRKLLGFKAECDAYMASLVSAPTNTPVSYDWTDTILRAAEPIPVEEWKLDFAWQLYTAEGNPEMTEEEFRKLTLTELGSKQAQWAQHIEAVRNILICAEGSEAEFSDLSISAQVSLLRSYTSPERLARLRTTCLKRARNVHEFDSSFRLHKNFVAQCAHTLTHKRFAQFLLEEAALTM